jgi:aspartate/methionine/tyrosine aminotransferase
MARVAQSALDVPHSRIRELADIAIRMDETAAGPGDRVLKLYFGESNLPTPEFIKRAAQKAMADGFTFYTANAGLLSLRRMLARYYQDMHRVELDPETEIVVTTSGVQALNAGIRCALDPGDEGIVLTPAWPNQSANVRMANGVVREIPHIVLGGRFTVDFDALEAAVTQRTRLLVYTSPSNPLGWTATEDEQRRLLDFARRHGLWLLADEVYERLYWRPEQTGTPAPSILRMATREDAVMVVQSFSKSYCMTGWRVGWLVARKDLAARATILNEFIISHAPSFAQRAAESALEWGDGEVKKMLAGYRANRDFCLAALRKMKGVQAPEPEGAFYLFPRIDAARDSFAFCKQLLLDTKVGLAPGIAFGAGGEGSVRICYAAERQVVETAMQRLAGFLS